MGCRKRVFYSGQVQGVGFRWTTRRIAGGFPVAGWVRNLPDGRVELVVEGEDSHVDGCLAAVSKHFGRMIRGAQVIPEAPEGLAGEFEITL